VRLRLAFALALALLLGVAPASAQALTLQASRSETGWIKLTVPDAGAATHVTLTEQVGNSQQPIEDAAPRDGQVVLRHAEIWRCDRFKRQFNATAAYPDGTTQTATTSIRTPSCAKRFTLSARKLRGRIRVRIGDRWKVGDASPRVCVRPPAHKAGCRSLGIPGGRRSARRDYRACTGGFWAISVGAVKRLVYIRPARKLRLLATGDSMIEYVDTSLKQRLATRRIGVRSDPRVSTGLSKPFLLNWPRHAAKQARTLRPDVTVVFIGANDGFPFGGVDCCGDAWVGAYAKRVEAMMRSYSRRGRGLVYWLTLPAPRPAQWRPIYPAVNRAIKRAAARIGGSTRVIDLAKTFTPDGRFRQSMVWHGRRQTVRQEDGVHLTQAGASIAETIVERALRKDGVL
jgi:lysophospholipase L1-like esterase